MTAATVTKRAAAPNRPASPILPTPDQVMALVCATVMDALQGAVRAENSTADWEDHFDHAQALALAAAETERLAGQLPMPLDAFDEARWKIEAVARLVRDSCPAKETGAWRLLDAAVQQMENASWLLEAVKPQARA